MMNDKCFFSCQNAIIRNYIIIFNTNDVNSFREEFGQIETDLFDK